MFGNWTFSCVANLMEHKAWCKCHNYSEPAFTCYTRSTHNAEECLTPMLECNVNYDWTCVKAKHRPRVTAITLANFWAALQKEKLLKHYFPYLHDRCGCVPCTWQWNGKGCHTMICTCVQCTSTRNNCIPMCDTYCTVGTLASIKFGESVKRECIDEFLIWRSRTLLHRVQCMK